ncbi:MAG: protein kinase [Phycisphaerales bacterium]
MSAADEAATRELFQQAASLDRADRARLLDSVRAEKPEIVHEVESLLSFHDTGDALLDHAPVPPAPRPGQPVRIGSYQIISEIGRGGMGVVYEAQQASPRRRVALKVIGEHGRPDHLTRWLEREAEILGMLDHPGIARVFEAGAALDDQGVLRAFVAMELVSGPTLSQYAGEQRLSMRQRLELGALVADAVDHAHRRGVIHRDLKPQNVVVTHAPGSRRPQPKVLDFGIARLTGAGGATLAATTAGQVVGTLEYMSPEQAGGDPRLVDTRSDVYSLGAMLCELLTGSPPISLAGMGITGAIAAICQQQPRRLGEFHASLRGDIESIVGKALDKDPGARYASAAELADDLRRHLSDRPVLARAPSTWYQVRAFARRRRGLVVGVAVATIALISLMTLAAWQAWRATRALDVARREAQRAEQTSGFLRRTLLAGTPGGSSTSNLTVREMLDGAAADLAARTDVAPIVAADTHQLLAEAYFTLSLFQPAAAHAREAMAASTRAGGPESEGAFRATAWHALALANLRRGHEALPLVEAALARARDALGPEHPVLVDLLRAVAAARLLQPGPQILEAERAAREGLELARRILPEDDERRLVLAQVLAAVLGATDQPERQNEAIEIDRALLHTSDLSSGPDHPRSLLLAMDLATLLRRAGRQDEAVSVLKERLPAARRVLGVEHAATIQLESELAIGLRAQGLVEQALPLHEHVYRQRLARFGPGHIAVVVARDEYIDDLLATDRCEQAAELIELQEQAKGTFGEGNIEPRLSILRFLLARCRDDVEGMIRFADRLRGTPAEPSIQTLLAKHLEARNAREADEPPPRR